jgi:hypothetical protein
MTESAQEYRKLEREALEQAARASDPKAREGFEQYAALWRQMAEQAEQNA